MERRDFLFTAGSATLAAAIGSKAAFAETKAHDHAAMKHNAPSKELKAIRDSSKECLEISSACLAHCNEMIMAGNTSIANCLNSVLNMRPVVEAMANAASLNSADPKSMKSLAATCAEFCRSCEAECKKHTDMKVCKECMEACAKCAKACEAFVKA